MNISIFITLLFGLQCFYWVVGKRASRNLGGQEDYFLAGKAVRLFPLMMTFLATQVGGGVVLGAAEEAYRFGWPVILYPFGAALGLILLGAGIGRKLAQFPVTTIAQIFEVVYRSTPLRRIASTLSVISLFMILVAQIIASSKFLVSLGFTNTPLLILFWAIVILYTAQGGLRAVISTDKVQAAFFSFVFLLCFGFVLYSNPSISTLPLPQLEHLIPVSSKLCGWLLMPLFFMVIEQDMGQRCFAGASPPNRLQGHSLGWPCHDGDLHCPCVLWIVGKDTEPKNPSWRERFDGSGHSHNQPLDHRLGRLRRLGSHYLHGDLADQCH